MRKHLLVILIAAGCAAAMPSVLAASPIPVTVTRAKRILKKADIQSNGKLMPYQSTMITAKTDGYIRAILFKEGQHIKKGAPVITLKDDLQEQAANSAHAKARLDKINYERNLKLKHNHLISPEDLDALNATASQSAAAANEADIAVADRTLRAPFTGTLGRNPLSLGQYVTAGQPLVSLVDTSRLVLSYQVNANNSTAVALNQPVLITDNNRHLSGSVSFISPAIDADSQTLTLHAILDNSKHLFMPGEFVTVSERIGMPQAILVIPSNAIVPGYHGATVFTVKKGHATSIPITVGSRHNNQVSITAGLKEGDLVITSDLDKLHDGAPVEPTKPAEQ